MRPIDAALAHLTPLLGTEIGVSDWFTIDQARIDRFAEVTEDHQFIHVDPARAAQTPFGGTIAHGFLTLSLASAMFYQVDTPMAGQSAGINYGFDKIRFIAPVHAGNRIRGRFVLSDVQRRSDTELQRKHEFTVETDHSDKPALAAQWVSLTLF